uniref:Beta-defensin n=1 Tax=Oryctolagus cuniculus TaxID=9986 RepID=A0A5F9DTS3_RABIT
MRVLLSVLGVLVLLLAVVPPASFFFKTGCPAALHNCRMKCKANEFAARYCADWSICCREKMKRRKKKRW